MTQLGARLSASYLISFVSVMLVSLSFSLSFFLSLSLSFSVSVSLSLFLSLCLSLSHYLSISHARAFSCFHLQIYFTATFHVKMVVFFSCCLSSASSLFVLSFNNFILPSLSVSFFLFSPFVYLFYSPTLSLSLSVPFFLPVSLHHRKFALSLLPRSTKISGFMSNWKS